jgi:hypothetical protein
MAEPAVHKIVRSKVSAERIGIEVRKIFQHPHYVTALSLASNLQLFDVLFPLTRKKSPWSLRELQEAMERVITLQRLQFGTEQPLFSARKEHQPATVLAYLLASFLPDQAHLYKAYTYGDPTQPGEYLHLGRSSLPNGVLKKYGLPDTSNAYYEMTQLVADQLRWPIAWSKLGNLLLHASQPWSQPGYAASIVSLLYSLQSSSQSSVEITPEQYTLFSGLVHNVKLAGPLYLHAICLGILCGPESASAAALTRELAVLLQDDADGCPLLAKGLLNGKMLHTQFGKTQITGNFTAMLLDEALIWQILHSFQNTPLTSLQLLQHLAEQRQLTFLE